MMKENLLTSSIYYMCGWKQIFILLSLLFQSRGMQTSQVYNGD